MESQVGDGFVTEYLCSLQKCEEILVLWQKKMEKLDCHLSSRGKHSKFEKLKVENNAGSSSSKKSIMVIETSKAFFNASSDECLCCISETTSRRREMHRINDCRVVKRVFPVGELEHINQRLKIIEEDMEEMKQAIIWHVKEKRRLVKRIYHYFQCMQYMLLHTNEVKGGVCHKKLIMKTPIKDNGGAGLPEVLCQNFNPSLITKGFQAAIYFSKKLQTTPTCVYDSSI